MDRGLVLPVDDAVFVDDGHGAPVSPMPDWPVMRLEWRETGKDMPVTGG